MEWEWSWSWSGNGVGVGVGVGMELEWSWNGNGVVFLKLSGVGVRNFELLKDYFEKLIKLLVN
jgi:hypothetical protein